MVRKGCTEKAREGSFRQWAQQRQRPRGGNVLEMIKGQGENGEEKRKLTDVPQGPRKQEGFVATVGMLALTE